MKRLGKYQIRRTLGKGAMGIVYEGFDPGIERTVAIKTILPAQLNGAEVVGVMARFKREAQAAGRLNHPGIVAIYEYGEELADEGTDDDPTMMAAPVPSAASAVASQRVAFIAMEFVQGRELKDFLDKGERFPLAEVARIMGEMLDALAHAHTRGVVHRDMKPANLILLGSGQVKVADFGIARIEASELTQAGAVMGTPSYMSPEQFMGHTVDGRSDIFSCGVILYQLLTGEKPFTGETTTTIMYKVLREEPAPPSQLNLALSPALDAVVRQALAKAPAQRFQTAQEFAAALQSAVAGDKAAATTGTLAGSAASPPPAQALPSPRHAVAATKAVPAPAAVPGPPARQALALWAVGSLVAVTLALGGYLLLASGRPPVASTPQTPDTALAPAPAPVAAPVPATVAAIPAVPATLILEAGTLVISARGMVDPQDARFGGDLASAHVAAREAARRQLVGKALALYVDPVALHTHRDLFEQKMLANSGAFIRTVLHEDASAIGKGGLVETETRAVISLRDVQRALNQLSRDERIEFIRNKGDPKISIQIAVANADSATPFARERSQLAENVVKERINSFGFRVWSTDGESRAGAGVQPADFSIRGEVRVKQLSARLAASGLTVTKTALTSWTLKAVEVASGEEVYLSTRLPEGKSWASEDQALAEIGKLVGDEFSRNFFLQHFRFRTQRTTLTFTGLPENAMPTMLRELRGLRPVLDAHLLAPARFQLHLAEGSTPDIVLEAIVRPLNTKLGQVCLTLAGVRDLDVTIAFSPACATPAMRAKLEAGLPGGSFTGARRA